MTDMFKPTVDTLNQGVEKSMKSAEEMFAFAQGNFEALTKSGQVWAAGAQDISKSIAAQAQAQMEETIAAVKSFAGVKSVKELMDLQSEFARRSVEKASAEVTRIADASQKLATEAMGPLTARANLAAELFSRAA